MLREWWRRWGVSRGAVGLGATLPPVAGGPPVRDVTRSTDGPVAGTSYGCPVATLETPFGRLVATLECSDSAPPTIIGRAGHATIRLPDLAVSWEHASVRWDSDADTHVIEHLGGSHGTYLDGSRVTSTRSLFDGGAIMIGKTVLIYHAAKIPVCDDASEPRALCAV